MKLYELTIEEYGKLLGSDAPAPGGGAASALSGMQGAALFSMVANLTIGRKKYEEYQEICKASATTGARMITQFRDLIEKDAAAFDDVSEAYKLPKETEEEKQARSATIGKAMIVATEVPLETMELALAALHETKVLLGRSNKNAASDLGVAALSLNACVRGAWLNVLINLSSIKDEEMRRSFEKKGRGMIGEAEALSEEIYQYIAANA